MVNLSSVSDVLGGAVRDRLGMEMCLGNKETVEGAVSRDRRVQCKAPARGNRKKGASWNHSR